MTPMKNQPDKAAALSNARDGMNIDATPFAPCLGLAVPHAWIFWVNSTASSCSSGIPWQSTYAIISFVLIGIAAAQTRHPAVLRLATSTGLAAISGSIGSILLIASAATNDPPITACALAVCAFSLSLSYVQWGTFYSKLDLRHAILFLFVSGIVAAAIKTAVFVSPDPIEAVACTALPFVSTMLLGKARRNQPAAPSTKVLFDEQNTTGLWKAAVAVIAFSAASAVLLAMTPSPKEAEGVFFFSGRLAEAFFCASVLVLVFTLHKTFDFPRFWKAILFIVATGILSYIVSPQTALQNVLAGASVNFIVLFVWLTLSDIARHSSMNPVIIFSVGWSCYSLPFFLGSMASLASGESIADPASLAFVLYAVSLVAAFCLEQRDRDIALIFSDLKQRPAEPSDFAEIDKRCALIAERYLLTERELEVMQHLCKGRSKAYIAEALFVTENTIKGHTKRIYSKLDVHSRKELQQVVDMY